MFRCVSGTWGASGGLDAEIRKSRDSVQWAGCGGKSRWFGEVVAGRTRWRAGSLRASRCMGLLLLRTMGSRGLAQLLWRMGLVALWPVGSSWTRDRTCVPCVGRRILIHCSSREVPAHTLLNTTLVESTPRPQFLYIVNVSVSSSQSFLHH